MIALIPTATDADRMALDGGEDVDALHLTLMFLGEDTDHDAQQRAALVSEMTSAFGTIPSFEANAFGVAVWNPNGDDPCVVLNVGGERLDEFHLQASASVRSLEMSIPEQHQPWSPHICLAYDPTRIEDGLASVGPVTFDRVRVAFGDDVTDVALGDSSGGRTIPWHKVNGHSECPSSRPWAVVKDSDGSVEGCHATEEDANAQLAALNASENSMGDTDTQTTTVSDQGAATIGTEFQQGDCPPGQHQMPDGSCMPDEDMDGDAAVEPQLTETVNDRWRGILAVEGVPTGDGREFASGALVWRNLPLSLYWQRQTADGHDQSVIVGSIDQIWRDGNAIRARGRFNLNAPDNGVSRADAWDAYQLVKDKFMRGVSVTLDDVKDADVEMVWPEPTEGEGEGEDDDLLQALFAQPEKIIIHHGRIIDSTLTGQPALQEAFIEIETDEMIADAPPPEPEFAAVGTHDTATSDDSWDAAANVSRLPTPMPRSTARAVYAWVEDGSSDVTKSQCKFPHHNVGGDGRPGAANLTACSAGIGILNGGRGGTSIPAVDRQGVYSHLAAHIRDAGREPPALASIEEANEFAALTAALTIPVAPPYEWFKNPGFTEVTPMQVGDDGWVRGHLARWGVCHTSFANTCVTPPHEEEFSYFTTGEIITREGKRVPVGQLTLGTGHAPGELGARPAAAHYDHTGYAIADVTAGADEHGIWVAGALCPDVDELMVRRLRASALSGDWRRIGGSLRLVAALVVNVPGFPIPRTKTRSREGAQTALVAAGIVTNVDPVVGVQASGNALPEKVARLVADTLRDRVYGPRVNELRARVHTTMEA
jgi:2'-5' RNA ligase